MGNYRKVRYKIVATVTTVMAFLGAAGSAAAATDSLEELSPLEKRGFERYLEQEQAFQESVETHPEITNTPPGWGPRTANPKRTDDNRIGLLHISHTPRKVSETCTANYVGGKFWITAYHCVDKINRQVGFIEQADNEFAGIENIYTKDARTDIALIKVGSGISADKFSLSSAPARVDDRLTVRGYGIDLKQTFSSDSTLRVIATDKEVHYPEDGYHFKDIVESVPVAPNAYRTVGGDSGSAVWSGSTVYGIHSGSSPASSFMTDVSKHTKWVEDTMRANSRSSVSEILRAFRGGIANNYQRDYSHPNMFGSSN